MQFPVRSRFCTSNNAMVSLKRHGMNLLSRLAPGEHGTNGKPFNYQTLCLADVERVRQTLAELEKAIKAREPQAATQHAQEPKEQ
jgi:hypothetical protein